MKNGPSKLNPNSAPFSPSVYEHHYIPAAAAEPFYYNIWWLTPELNSLRLLSTNTMAKALGICRRILEQDLLQENSLVSYLNSGRFSKMNGLLSHPLSQLFIPPPRERYIHPAITDHCLYALRIDKSDGKFCLAASSDCPGLENNVDEDWMAAIVGFIYYGLPSLKGPLGEHICIRKGGQQQEGSSGSSSSASCWLCELNYVFENLDYSRSEGKAQPVSIRALIEALMDCQAMSPLISHDTDPTVEEGSVGGPSQKSDISHSLLSRKLYRRKLLVMTPLLNEVHQSTNSGGGGGSEDMRLRRANRICNGVRIRQHDRGLSSLIERNRANVNRKVLHTLNYVMHILNKATVVGVTSTSTKRRSVEFPRLGEEPPPPPPPSQQQNIENNPLDLDGSEFLKLYVDSHCTCPLTKTATTTVKDMLLLPLNFDRYETHKQQCNVPQIISPDSSELSAFEDSEADLDSSSSDSDIVESAYSPNESNSDSEDRFSSATSTPARKSSFNVFTAAAYGALPKKQPTVKFVELLTESLDHETEIVMMCPQCCKAPNAGVRPHKVRDVVTKLPVVLGIKTVGNDDFWVGPSGGDLRSLVRKYLKAKKQHSSREVVLASELSRIASYHPLPSQLFIGRKNDKWDVRPTRTNGYVEYSLCCVITSGNVTWDAETRSTLWRIWHEDFDRIRDSKMSTTLLQNTEIEELMVERPPSEDIVCASVKRPDGKWILINGPLVAEVTEADVRSLSVAYKRPITVFYSRVLESSSWTLSPSTAKKPTPDVETVLPWNLSTAMNRLQNPPFTPITSTEKKLIELGRFTLALDAEYVVTSYINKAKNHLFGKAPRYELGRFTGVRADNVFQEPVAFADLYVNFNSMPIDCRTEFSGLVPQDLNYQTSSRWLVHRDYVYRLVRYLVKNKCKFVGHDLFNDFRVIGITVPSNLVYDTVLLYRLSPHSRLLSLKYLAWHVLQMRIQTATHDSLEDSWASLQLYRFYLKYLKEQGEEEFLSSFVSQIYATGYNTNFKTPPPPPPPPPPI